MPTASKSKWCSPPAEVGYIYRLVIKLMIQAELFLISLNFLLQGTNIHVNILFVAEATEIEWYDDTN
jgi:hypothetical protein